MSQAALPGAGAGDRPRWNLPPFLVRGIAMLAIAVLLGFIGVGVRHLWGEYEALRWEQWAARHRAVIGYPGIHATPSFASPPRVWLRTERDHTLLWAGWRDGVGHSWFRVGPGELDPQRLSLPVGRDNTRPIDTPLVEVGGGDIWGRIPDDASVASTTVGGVSTAYPLVVLGSVAIVNDLIGDRPLLVTFNQFALESEYVQVYVPVVAGHRVTLGPAGIDRDGHPVFYDRGSESLWVADGEVLRAFAGHHKGATLPRLDRPAPLAWSRWRADHPRGRLVVGADRQRSRPTD